MIDSNLLSSLTCKYYLEELIFDLERQVLLPSHTNHNQPLDLRMDYILKVNSHRLEFINDDISQNFTTLPFPSVLSFGGFLQYLNYSGIPKPSQLSSSVKLNVFEFKLDARLLDQIVTAHSRIDSEVNEIYEMVCESIKKYSSLFISTIR